MKIIGGTLDDDPPPPPPTHTHLYGFLHVFIVECAVNRTGQVDTVHMFMTVFDYHLLPVIKVAELAFVGVGHLCLQNNEVQSLIGLQMCSNSSNSIYTYSIDKIM